MIYKKYLILYFFLLLSIRLVAFQAIEKEQLKIIDSLNAISWKIKQTNIENSQDLAKEALRLSDQLNYKKGKQQAIKNFAVLDIFKGNYDSALLKSEQFLELTLQRKDTIEMANAYNIIGSVYYYKGELEIGIKNYLQSLKLKEKIGDLIGTAKLYNNISTIYIGQHKYERSIEYNLKSIKIKQQLKDSISLANSYNNLGFAYRERTLYDSALYYSSLGLSIITPTDNELLKSSLYSNTGDIYLEMKVLDSAFYMFNKSIEISTNLKENRTIIYAYLGVGKVYAAQSMFNLALPYLEKGKRLALAIHAKKEIADAFLEVSNTLENLDRYKEAYSNRKQYEMYKDSVNNEKNNRTIEELERVYKYEKQQAQIHQFEAESKYQKDIFNRQRKIGLGLMVLLLIMAVLAYFLVQSNKAKRKAINGLEQKNVEIRKQQISIKNQNELLNDKNKKLLQLDEEKNHLVSVVAHDLRSPLANIMGIVGIINMESDNLTEKQLRFFNKINESSEKLNDMISKVLSRENIEHAELKVELVKCNVETIIAKSIESLQQNAITKKIEITVQTAEDVPQINLDKKLTLQILTNLISNALKFSPSSKSIIIRTEVKDANIEIHVIDEGPGLTKEDQRKLFGRYQRLSAKPTAGESSTGLGLSIVKQYVELMGGTISFSNALPHGADFMLQFSIK